MRVKWYLFILTVFTISTFLFNFVENQNKPLIKIGVLMIGESRYEKYSGVKKGLMDLGYKENEIQYIIKNAKEQRKLLDTHINDLLKESPDVIVTLGSIETLQLKARMGKTNQKIPVVFAGVAAPKESGIIENYRSPGGLFTGINNYHTSISEKRLEIFRDLVPTMNNVHVLYDEEIEVSRISLTKTREAAEKLSISLQPNNVSDPNFFSKLEQNLKENDAILIMPGFKIEGMTDEIVKVSKKYHIPVMGLYEHEVEKGYLASYGASFFEQGEQAARYVSLILQGNSPGDIPVEMPDTIRFLLNNQVKDELGISVNSDLMYIAELIHPIYEEGEK